MLGKHAKKAFITGLAALLPTALTILLLAKAYEVLAAPIGNSFSAILLGVLRFMNPAGWEAAAWLKALLSAAGVVLSVAAILAVGLVLASFIGRKLWSYVEKALLGVPIVRTVYPPLKQMTDFVFTEKKFDFRRVVVIEYPRKGVWSLGFITGKAFQAVSEAAGREMVVVFVPSSPTPFTGYVVHVPRDYVIELDMSVDAAVRFVVSGGVIPPELAAGTAAKQVAYTMEAVEGEAQIARGNPGAQE